MKKGKRFTEEQTIKVLQEIDAGATVAPIERAFIANGQFICRWKSKLAWPK